MSKLTSLRLARAAIPTIRPSGLVDHLREVVDTVSAIKTRLEESFS